MIAALHYFLGPVGGWFMHYTGANGESGPWYGFWSGFGGAIPDFLILGGLVTFYRQRRCHNEGCWVGPKWLRRWGSHTTKSGHHLCKVCIGLPNTDLTLNEIHADHT